ncbi:MAG: VacB/RNase II family 3'-5' exoribonuclease [Candidatus Eisenbacteria bacterium]
MRKARTRSRGWRIVGRLQRSSPRYGFVVNDGGEGDVYVASRHLAGALDGDEVEINVRRSPRSGLLEGRVERVVHRPARELTGVVAKTRGGHVLIPDAARFPAPLVLAGEKTYASLEGRRVVAELIGRHAREVNRCSVREVLGDAGDARLDSLIVAKELGIPVEFGGGALQESASLSEPSSEGRAELRDHLVFTIDPEEAHDFDDAVSLRRVSGDLLEVGVHIADVSAYVDEGRAVDLEAMERGNSVYLPDTVFPMLPQRLSNELCSLTPGDRKLCISILMEVTPDGEVRRTRFVETVINSVRRLSYDEAESALEGRLRLPPDVDRALRGLSSLSVALKDRRRVRGAVELEVAELKTRLLPDGKPEGLCLDEKKGSHSLIEELMILANTEVAARIEEKHVPFLYRVHPKMKKEELEKFFRAVKIVGADEIVRPREDFRRMGHRIESLGANRRKRLLTSLFVRTMEKAVYSVSNTGHYGLAADSYCHFTSPIRRYADLVDHRIAKHCLVRGGSRIPRQLESRLPAVAELCSAREVRADDAERKAERMKSLRFMQRFVGDVFEGIIVGVIGSGFFVETFDHWVEGVVSRDVLGDDAYFFDEATMSLVGRRRGRRYSLGQTLDVQIARVDPIARAMDVVPAG